MSIRSTKYVCLAVSAALGPLWLAAPAATAVDYETDIKPLLKRRCYPCHGPVKQKAGLRLDAGALIPNDIHDELLRRVSSGDELDRMPPEGARLTEDQIASLRAWIAEGAPYPKGEAVPRK